MPPPSTGTSSEDTGLMYNQQVGAPRTTRFNGSGLPSHDVESKPRLTNATVEGGAPNRNSWRTPPGLGAKPTERFSPSGQPRLVGVSSCALPALGWTPIAST